MKNFLLGIGALTLAQGAIAQNYIHNYAPDGADDYVIIRDLEEDGNGNMYAGFDFHQGATMPDGGIMKMDDKGDVIWSKVLDYGADADATCTFEVLPKDDGNVYLWGLKELAGASTAILLELDGDGNILWAKDYPMGYNSSIYTVNKIMQTEAGNLQMLMTVYNYSYLMETDANGEIDWGYRMTADTLTGGKSPGFAWSSVPGGGDDDGGVCTGKRGNDLSFARFDGDGNVIWDKRVTLTAYNHATSILRLGDDKAMFGGYLTSPSGSGYIPFTLQMDETDGTIDWVKYYEGVTLGYASGVDLMFDENGDILMNMNYDAGSWGEGGGHYIFKIDESGNLLAATQLMEDYILKDYNKLKVDGEVVYNYGGYIDQTTSKYMGTIDKRDNLFDETCVMVHLEGVTATEYTAWSDVSTPPGMVEYTDMAVTAPTISDVHLSKEEVCSTVSTDLDEQLNTLEVYPNPTEGSVTIAVEGSFSYTLLNLNGQQVLNGNGANQLTVELGDIAPGIYSLNVEAADQLLVKKLIVR